ncbi:S1C family serine protease [Oceanithermus sp.]
MWIRKSLLGLVGVLVVAAIALTWNLPGAQATGEEVEPFKQPEAFLENERNTIGIVEAYGDGVVYVSVASAPKVVQPQLPPGFEQFAPFFGPYLEPPRQGTGSGFVIDKEGYILTNFHVVDGADKIEVKFHNDPKPYPAKLVGSAPPLDLALLKVDAPADRLRPIPLGDSDTIKVGQKAIAIGNPFGLEFSVTEGIVSAIRTNPGAESSLIPKLIQTDAAINPGNSGGPLLNSRGEVIGINAAIINPNGVPQFAGIGFAIPINLAKQYIPNMKAGKQVTAEEIVKNNPRLGVTVLPARYYPEQVRQRFKIPDYGLVIQEVEKNSPAEEAGLQGAKDFIYLQTPDGNVIELGVGGDVIVEADGQPIYDITDLRAVLYSLKPGEKLTLKVVRDGKERTVTVVPRVVK